MIVIELISLSLFLALGVLASITDVKRGIISNKVVLIFFSAGVVIDAIYYGFFARDLVTDFLINFGIIVIISLVLYFSKTWAAGDVKLLITLSLLIPARSFVAINGHIYTLPLGVGIAFIIAYLFLLSLGIYSFITGKKTGKNKIDAKSFGKGLIKWVKSYCVAFIYCSFLDCLYVLLISKLITINNTILTIAYVAIIYVILSIKPCRNRIVVAVIFVLDVVGWIYLKSIPISSNPFIYIIVIVLVLIQLLMQDNLYLMILAKDITKGMILSTDSSIVLMTAGVNIRRLSKENLSDRLTDDEAQEIKRWGIGTEFQLKIVRKVPFGIFIFLGLLVYILVGGIIRCI